jgi:hypothetical protein
MTASLVSARFLVLATAISVFAPAVHSAPPRAVIELFTKDTLAKHIFIERQQAYAAMRGDGQVYTPQAVVNGSEHAVGSQALAIEAAVGETS